MYIHLHTHVITINEKDGMNFKGKKERYIGWFLGRKRKGKRRHAALLQRPSLSTVETPSHSDNRNIRHRAQRRLLRDLTPALVSAEVRHFTIKPPVRHWCFRSLEAEQRTPG